MEEDMMHAPGSGRAAAIPESLIDCVNAVRSPLGLAPLTIDPALQARSSAWAAVVARSRHLDPGDSPHRIITIRGRNGTIAGVVRSWMEDSCNRRLLLGNYQQIGAGEEIDIDGLVYHVVDFGNPTDDKETAQ